MVQVLHGRATTAAVASSASAGGQVAQACEVNSSITTGRAWAAGAKAREVSSSAVRASLKSR